MDRLNDFFMSVSKPVRYIGGEVNQIKKDPSKVKLKFALCFPDIYEIGMSHTGGKIIYKMLNDEDEILCERVFAPWIDAMEEMKKRGLMLFSLENRIALRDFDIVGFSLHYEMSFSTTVQMLTLGGIEPLADRRDDTFPLIIAGGPSVYNPEPVAGIFDLFYLGDAEANLITLLKRYIQLKNDKKPKRVILEKLSEIEGVYVPSLFDIRYDGLYLTSKPEKKVARAIIPELKKDYFPESQIVPHLETVQDRFVVEIQRGCNYGCRFCFAGYIYRPVRQREGDDIYKIVMNGIKNTGFQEVSFLSLNAGDHRGLEEVLKRLNESLSQNKISLSLPSLRVDTASSELIRQIAKVKKTGITIAPEVGSERMRQKINKNFGENDVIKSVEIAFSYGWELIKLYFIIGLPDETDEDIHSISELSYKILDIAKRYKKRPDINVTISPFIPKPHTPLQWEGLDSVENLQRKLNIIRKCLRHPAFKIKKSNLSLTVIEALLSRGDRRVLDIILNAVKRGAYLDAWSDCFDISKYLESEQDFYNRYGIKISDYLGKREIDRPLAWDHISVGISEEFLKRENEKYHREIQTENCLIDICSQCGVCNGKIKNVMASKILRDQPDIISKKMHSINESQTYYRIQYSKEGDMIYASHLDIINIFTKALIKSGLPLLYRGEFNPRPEISTGPALPIGVISTTEFLDFTLRQFIKSDFVLNILSKLLPNGINPRNITISNSRLKPISTSIVAARFDVYSEGRPTNQKIQEVLKLPEIRVYKKRGDLQKEVEIRRFIHNIEINEKYVSFLLLYKDGKTANIFDVLNIFGIQRSGNITIRKDKVYFTLDDI